MAWEERNGNLYYYRKRRQGNRVVSEYVGKGAWIHAMATLEKRERDRLRYEHWKKRQEINEYEDMRSRLNGAMDSVRDLVQAALLLNGYHTHKGQWRKKRER